MVSLCAAFTELNNDKEYKSKIQQLVREVEKLPIFDSIRTFEGYRTIDDFENTSEYLNWFFSDDGVCLDCSNQRTWEHSHFFVLYNYLELWKGLKRKPKKGDHRDVKHILERKQKARDSSCTYNEKFHSVEKCKSDTSWVCRKTKQIKNKKEYEKDFFDFFLNKKNAVRLHFREFIKQLCQGKHPGDLVRCFTVLANTLLTNQVQESWLELRKQKNRTGSDKKMSPNENTV